MSAETGASPTMQLSPTITIGRGPWQATIGISTCQTCGALVLSSSGEAIDLHAKWHAESSAVPS